MNQNKAEQRIGSIRRTSVLSTPNTSKTQSGCSSTALPSSVEAENTSTDGGGGPSTTTATATATTSSLLQDDELGSDLLLAIRDWNTESSRALRNDTDDDESFSDDKNSSMQSLEKSLDKSWKEDGAVDSTIPNKTEKTCSSYRTSNYSCKPSAITDRLLKSISATPSIAPPMSIITEMDGFPEVDNEVTDDNDSFLEEVADEVLDEHEVTTYEQVPHTATSRAQIWDGLEEEFSLYSEDEEEEDLASLYKHEPCHHGDGVGNSRDDLALPYQKQYENNWNGQTMAALEADSDAIRSLDTKMASAARFGREDQALTTTSCDYFEQENKRYTRTPVPLENDAAVLKSNSDYVDSTPNVAQRIKRKGNHNHVQSSIQTTTVEKEEKRIVPQQQSQQRRKLTAEELYVKHEYLKRQLAVVETQLYVDYDILFHQENNSHETACENDGGKSFLEKSEANEILLQKVCYSLGLPKTRTDALLPTVQKMVNVVTKHVPRLEDFAEKVCDLVLVDDRKPNKIKEKKKTKKSAMKKKHERMEHTINTLRKQKAEKESHGPGLKSLRIIDPASKVGGKEVHSVSSSISAESRGSSSTVDAVPAAISFQKAILDQLEQRQRREQSSNRKIKKVSNDRRECSPSCGRVSSQKYQSSQDASSSVISNDEALKIIQQLIEFEYRNKRSLYCAPREVLDDEAKKYGGLLAADATSLRRYVSYFMHLFNVRHVNGVRPKMNEVYVYSTAMTSMFRDMREALHMEPSSPAQDVARRVVEISNEIGNMIH